ncbi:MAG: tetratricopeptide repeat protein [Pseudomonadota bacterium]
MASRVVGLVLSLTLFVLATERAAAVEVAVSEPAWRFAPEGELYLDEDLRVAAEEFELSQELRPLLRREQYDIALASIQAFPPPHSPALDLLEAQLHAILSRFDAAIEVYRRVLEAAPGSIRANAGLGTLYLLTGQERPARDRLARALSLGATDVQTYGQLGYLNLKLAHPWSAISAYQSALVHEPDNPQWQQGLLTALVASGNAGSASALIDQLLGEAATNVSVWQQRARLALQQQDTDRAVASLEAALRLGDATPANRQAAAQLHLSNGNYSRAAALLEANVGAGEVEPADLIRLCRWLLARDALRQAQALADAQWRRRAGLSAVQVSALMTVRGDLAAARGDAAAATAAYRRALERDAANGQALIALAKAQRAAGALAQAAVLFQRASALESVRRNGLLGVAQVAVDRGDYEAALATLRDVRRAYPDEHGLDGQIDSLTNLVAAQRAERTAQ